MNFLRLIFASKPVVEKDVLSGKYIAYYKNDLGIVSQGETKQEAIANLKEDIQIIKNSRESIKAESKKADIKPRVAHS